MSHSVWTGSLQILKKEATACDVLFTPKLHCNRDGRFPVNVALDYLREQQISNKDIVLL